MRCHKTSSFLLLALASAVCPAQSQTDRFGLVCTSTVAGTADLKLGVFIFVNGAEITDLGVSPPAKYELAAYVKALRWSDGKYEYHVDRFTGVLKLTPGNMTFNCEKRGGKKF